jgi:RHS repeat-associated protein
VTIIPRFLGERPEWADTAPAVGAGVVSLSLYKAWGESRGGAGTLLTDYGFNGQRSMEGTIGLQYFNARWYDRSLSRWAQPDSILPIASQGVQAWDRYEFTNNNSVNFADSTGHSVDCGLMEPGCKHIPLADEAYTQPYDNNPNDNTNDQDSPESQVETANKPKPPVQNSPGPAQQCVPTPTHPCPETKTGPNWGKIGWGATLLVFVDIPVGAVIAVAFTDPAVGAEFVTIELGEVTIPLGSAFLYINYKCLELIWEGIQGK